MNARTAFLVREEAKKVKARLGTVPDSPQRVVSTVAKLILLDGPYFYNGHQINPVAKSIGAGVWEIRNEKL